MTNKEVKVAYFCTEFALDDKLPIYSGGLGVLAGDVIREANDEEFPLVGVGLFYQKGYFRQWIVNGEQNEVYEEIDPINAGLEMVTDKDGKAIIIDMLLGSTPIYARIWKYKLSHNSVLLLDTNIDLNTDHHKGITCLLYGGDFHTRIEQEIVLGIGGVKALNALGYQPKRYHLNEGHSAFAIFELIGQEMKLKGIDFKTASHNIKEKLVFTNHTLVPAGNDIFSKYDLGIYLGQYAENLNLPIEDLLKTGELPEDPHSFAMTHLSLNSCKRTNAVSHLHSVEARKIWPNYHLLPITNGVNLPFWVSWPLKQASPTFEANLVNNLSGSDLWKIHLTNKQKLIDEVALNANVMFDIAQPIIVWARRFTEYKQPELLFSDIERLKSILESTSLPFNIVLAGKAHPSDIIGKNMIADINKKIIEHKLEKKVVFLPHYTMTDAKYLTSGADVWLNTPTRGREASGTSGMKAGANGVLLCSTKDGWMDEVDWTKTGWIIDSNPAHSLYHQLEESILPTYYKKETLDYSREWVARMKKTINIVWPEYSTKRMFKEYKKLLYDLD